ncbi:MAG: hypothetical protein OEL20_14945 [Sulfuritalea sp.]|nr:hypothetical protein [Sulfuritalea sp.]
MMPLPLHVDPALSHSLGAALSLVFLFGAWQKLHEREEFAGILENYRLLPVAMVGWMAYLLPLIEAVAGLLLLFQETRLPGALLAFALLLLVTSAVAINLVRGYSEIECGCGGFSDGVSGQVITWGLVLRNLALIAALPWIAGQSVVREMVWIDYTTVACATLALLGLYALVSQLLATQPRLDALRNS